MATSEALTPIASQDVHRVARELVTRSVVVVGLAGIALIHLLDSISKFQETPYVGWLYVALMVSTLAVAAALVTTNARAAWLASMVLAGLAILAYVLSRTTGLPESTGDVGNWSEPLGLAALFTEGAVVAVSGYVLATLEPVRARRPDQRARALAIS